MPPTGLPHGLHVTSFGCPIRYRPATTAESSPAAPPRKESFFSSSSSSSSSPMSSQLSGGPLVKPDGLFVGSISIKSSILRSWLPAPVDRLIPACSSFCCGSYCVSGALPCSKDVSLKKLPLFTVCTSIGNETYYILKKKLLAILVPHLFLLCLFD